MTGQIAALLVILGIALLFFTFERVSVDAKYLASWIVRTVGDTNPVWLLSSLLWAL